MSQALPLRNTAIDTGTATLPSAVGLAPRDRRRTLLGAGVSLLIHAVLLLIIRHQPDTPLPPHGELTEPLSVRLIYQAAPAVAQAPPAEQPKKRPEKKRKKAVAPPIQNAEAPPLAQIEPPSEPIAQEEPPMDMSTMINAARARRQQAEESAARVNAEATAANQVPSANDIVMANIQRSLQGKRDSTGGVFQVVRKGARTGTFIFRGWKPGARNTLQQTFEVDAGLNGDVELAIVRRMILLIRTYYTGDFNWESHRLGRVLVKSARVEDTTELEAFLMREFFGG